MPVWNDLIDHYRNYHEVSGPLKVATLAQWIVESGRGRSKLARDHLNFGGLKFRERMVGYADPVDYRGSDGELTTYCKFGSVQAFVSGYWHFIESGPYDGWDRYKDDPAGYIRHLARKGYAADPDYIVKVLDRLDEARTTLGEAVPPITPGAGSLVRLAIVVGHNRIAQGANAVAPLSQSEFVFNNKVAREMKESATHYNITAEVFNREPSSSYKEEIRDAYARVARWNPDCAVELHFNSIDNPSVSRSEVFCKKGSLDAAALSEQLLEEIVDLLKLENGGVKRIDLEDRGGRSVYALPNVPTALVEPFFGSNRSDCMKVATVGEDALALCYLRGVRDWVVARVA